VSLIVVVAGIAVTSVFPGIGQLAHALIGTPTAWSAFSGVVAGGSWVFVPR
jgi:hypothetical protein